MQLESLDEITVTEEQALCQLARAVLHTEAQAVADLAIRIDAAFAKACQYLLHCKGRIVVTGMGKSGHIGSKIAATFASTGSPAFFVHPGEASHGDLGMITRQDVVVALSYSGQTQELLVLVPLLQRLKVPLIALTGYPQSPLAQAANVHLNVSVTKEACPLGLAPTASTTATLAMGDALAVALLETRGFTEADFALSHPGGSLGRRLLLKVDELLQTGDALPKVHRNTKMSEALVEMTQKRLGMTTVIDDLGQLCGIFTDGDLRRMLDKNVDIHQIPIHTVMTAHCKTITTGMLAAAALQMMETYKITTLVAVNSKNIPVGVLHIHDLLAAGVG